MKRNSRVLAISFALGVLTPAIYAAISGARAAPEIIARATFTADGKAELPVGYRQWAHVGTRIKLDGINILDRQPITTPEMLDAYVEPTAMSVYQKTGRWPEGAQIVKEFSTIRMGEGCNETTRNCETAFGSGIFQSGYRGLGMMVKDSVRFPSSPGNWGYFDFGHKPPPYDTASAVQPISQCAECHSSVASDTDYVVSRSHIGLERNAK